ncbi:MAG: hypothetical protein N4A46_02815 [Schleiferiaceae bacterium]|jgi:hypothetical protein|nr:hypothetical protein [Schleiferiaceae bacterium]
MSRNKKLSDKEFWIILRDCGGLYARTRDAIKNQFGIEYSRQAARERALKNPDEFEDILEESLDLAEESLRDLMQSDDERIKFQAVSLFLKTKGKIRGYTEQQEIKKLDEIKVNVNVVSNKVQEIFE